MISQNPADSINLLYNQQKAYNDARAAMFFTPTVNTACWDFPEFSMYGNNLLNPMLAIQQTMQSFQNGGWMNGMGANGNWFNNMFSNMFNNPWNNNVNNNNNNNGKLTDEEKAKEEVMQNQYNRLKAILQKFSDENTSLSDELKAKLKVALNKTGKTEEKLNALKSIYKELDNKELRKAVLALDENKIALNEMGYNFDNAKFSLKNQDDQTLKNAITSMETEIADGRYDTLQTYAPNAETNTQVMKLISYWNDTHTTKDNRSIIRFIGKHLPTDNAKKDNAKRTVEALTTGLINKAKEVSGRVGNCEKLDKAHQELLETLTKTNKSFDKAHLEKLAAKFEEVYARIRIVEAQELNKKLVANFKFLNDIDSTDTDFINNKIVVEDTEADLKAEGITIPSDIDVIDNGNQDREDVPPKTVEESVKELVQSGKLSKAMNQNRTSTIPNLYEDADKNYYAIRNGKLYKLDIKPGYVWTNGKCKQSDGTSIKIENAKGTEVDPTTIGTSASEEADDAENTEVDTSSSGKMEELAKDNKMTETDIIGYYRKGRKYYRYDLDTETFEYLPGVTKVNANGTVDKNGEKNIPVREVEGARAAGETLRQKIAGDTSTEEYTIAYKKLNSFSTYTDEKDIVNFIKGYNDKKAWYAMRNSKLAAQIVTEEGISENDKKKYIKVIAEKAIIVAKKAKISMDSDIMSDLKEIAKGTFESSFWSRHWWSHCADDNLISTARVLDSLIEDVIEAYDKLDTSEQT